MSKDFIKTGVIGHPIAHSKSPLIHNTWIKELGLCGAYQAIDLSCENLEQGVKDLIKDGYSGFNITVPHKVAIMQLCGQIDELARAVGAVNTIIIKNGILHGTNTDVFGFTQNIKATQPQFSFTRGAALVLGAGGAARAVVQGLLMEDTPEIYIANRTQKNADELLRHVSNPQKIKVIPWDDRANKKYLQNINLIVNTTSLGMIGKPVLEMDLSEADPAALVNDIVYAPLYTPLLLAAKERGNPFVTGIGMLLHQARPAFAAWYGVMPSLSQELQNKVLV